MISNILVTDDATEASDKAIEKASELAEQMNVPVEDLDSSLHLSKNKIYGANHSFQSKTHCEFFSL